MLSEKSESDLAAAHTIKNLAKILEESDQKTQNVFRKLFDETSDYIEANYPVMVQFLERIDEKSVYSVEDSDESDDPLEYIDEGVEGAEGDSFIYNSDEGAEGDSIIVGNDEGDEGDGIIELIDEGDEGDPYSEYDESKKELPSLLFLGSLVYEATGPCIAKLEAEQRGALENADIWE